MNAQRLTLKASHETLAMAAWTLAHGELAPDSPRRRQLELARNQAAFRIGFALQAIAAMEGQVKAEQANEAFRQLAQKSLAADLALLGRTLDGGFVEAKPEK